MSKQWSSGLFECMVDTMQCLDTCICGPCSLSRQYMAAVEGQANTFSLPHCIAGWLCGQCMNCYIRMKVVEKYSIEEGVPISIAIGWVCGSCSTCQTHRELSVNKTWPGGNFLHKEPWEGAR